MWKDIGFEESNIFSYFYHLCEGFSSFFHLKIYLNYLSGNIGIQRAIPFQNGGTI